MSGDRVSECAREIGVYTIHTMEKAIRATDEKLEFISAERLWTERFDLENWKLIHKNCAFFGGWK